MLKVRNLNSSRICSEEKVLPISSESSVTHVSGTDRSNVAELTGTVAYAPVPLGTHSIVSVHFVNTWFESR